MSYRRTSVRELASLVQDLIECLPPDTALGTEREILLCVVRHLAVRFGVPVGMLWRMVRYPLSEDREVPEIERQGLICPHCGQGLPMS